MRRGIRALLLGAGLAASTGTPVALADIFVWIDAAGATHVSNLPPPQGSREVSVTRSTPRDAAQEAAAREAARLAELRALDQRVKELEVEAEQARRDAAQASAAARAAPAPPAPAPVVIVMAPPPPPAPAYTGPAGPCDFAWGNCGWGLWPGFYSPVVVLREGRDRVSRHHAHFDRASRDGHFPSPHPVPSSPFPKPLHWRK